MSWSNRRALGALAAGVVALLVYSVASTSRSHNATRLHALPALSAPSPTGCMGPCVPTFRLGTPPSAPNAKRIPDVSEWQPCVDRPYAAVIRLYESGTAREDSHAPCNAAALHRWHVWYAGYTFLRPGSCTAEAQATVRIVRSLGGLNGPVIADAEVALPDGFVRCFLAAVHRGLPSYPLATYTGCYSGLEIVDAWWVPDYGVRAPCTRGGLTWAAWQYADGTYCGEAFVADCSIDNGILRLHPAPLCGPRCRLDRALRSDIAGRDSQRASALRAEHNDWLLARALRAHRPQSTRYRRAAYGRERERQYELGLIATDNRLIALWRSRL